MSDLQQNRISVQEILLMFSKQISGTGAKSGEKYIPVADVVAERGYVIPVNYSDAPSSFILQREKDANRVAYNKEDLQRFVNGFDSLSVSLLQPYIRFEKYNKKRDETFVLDMNNANLASFRSFISGARTGKGSVGFGTRQNPGGFGIKGLELEYLANEKSGYCFNQYKLDVEVFCASIEDLVANLGDGKSSYTLMDVLIAFPEDIKRLLEGIRAGETEGEMSSAFKTVVEFGYNVHESEKGIAQKLAGAVSAISSIAKAPTSITKSASIFSAATQNKRSEQTKMLIKQSGSKGLASQKFSEMLSKLRFRVFLTPYKWVVEFEQKGNISLKIQYLGYDNAISAKAASNVMASFEEVEYYQKSFMAKRSGKPVSVATTKKEMEQEKKEIDAARKKLDSERASFWRVYKQTLMRRPYARLGAIQRSFELTVDYSVFEQTKPVSAQPGQDLSFSDKIKKIRNEIYESLGSEDVMNKFAQMYKGHGVSPKENWESDYDFNKIIDDEGRDSHLTVKNKYVVGKEKIGTVTRFEGGGIDGPPVAITEDVYKNLYISRIPYFYLGDLLGILSLTVSHNLKQSGEHGAGTRVEFLTDQIKIPAPWFPSAELEMNIGQIPISWDFFLKWWADKVETKKNMVYKLEEFLQEFFGHFIQQLFKKTEVVDSVILNIGCHVIEKEINKQTGSKIVSYYLYQVLPEKDPSVRFYIGNARGLLKDVQFEVVDDQYLSSSCMQMAVENQQPDNNLQFQRAIYNSTITMFGNVIFQPGMTVEVVPSLVGAPFADSSKIRNIYDLGIGGLFNITATKISLRKGNFETKLTTRWWGKPQQKMVDLSSMEIPIFSGIGSGLGSVAGVVGDAVVARGVQGAFASGKKD